jgi:hypothetical protein
VSHFFNHKDWCVCYIRPHICHKEIHARFSETDLARRLNTVQALRDAPELQDFIAWIARRPPEFISRVKGGRR